MEYSFTNVWGSSWEVYRRSWKILFAAVAVYMLANLPSIGASLGQNIILSMQRRDPQSVGPQAMSIASVLGCFNFIYTVFVVTPLMAGVMWLSLRTVRNEPAQLNDLMQGYRRFPSLIGAYFLLTLIVLVPVLLAVGVLLAITYFGMGFDAFKDGIQWTDFDDCSRIALGLGLLWVLVCYLAMLFISIRLAFVWWLVTDKSQGPLGAAAAIERSWNITRGRVLSLLGLFITIGVMMMATTLCCCLPLFVLGIPLGIVQCSLAYDMLLKRGEGEVVQTVPAV